VIELSTAVYCNSPELNSVTLSRSADATLPMVLGGASPSRLRVNKEFFVPAFEGSAQAGRQFRQRVSGRWRRRRNVIRAVNGLSERCARPPG